MQESPAAIPTTGYTARPGNAWIPHTSGTDPNCRMVFRFTDIAVGQGFCATVLSVANVAPFQEVTFQDCRVRGGLVSVAPVQVNGPRTVRFVNNIWERSTPRVTYYAGSNPSPYNQYPVTVDCRNNLFRDSYLLLIYQANNGTPGVWETKDNLLHQTANVATTDTQGAIRMLRSNNGFTVGTANGLGGTDNRLNLQPGFEATPQGEYFYLVGGGLDSLVDHGSRMSFDAGMACATTHATFAPDTGTVDIGFHYHLQDTLPSVSPLSVVACSAKTAIDLTQGVGEGCAISYEIVDPPEHGTLLGSAPYLVYQPSDPYEGTDSFTYKVSDGMVESDTATVHIDVQNFQPLASGRSVRVCGGGPVTITLRGQDECPEPLTLFQIVTYPQHGVLGPVAQFSDKAARVTYTPTDPGFSGEDVFEFRVRDRWKYSAPATVSVQVNGAPEAGNPTYYAFVGCPINIVLPGRGCEPLTYEVPPQPPPLHGELCGTPPNMRYEPHSVGTDTFSYTVTDAMGAHASPGLVTIVVGPGVGDSIWTDVRSPADLAALLCEPGATIANATFTGAVEARGVFGNGTSAGLPFDTGVILSTGDISLARGPNDKPGAGLSLGNPGDTQLDMLLDPLEPYHPDFPTATFDTEDAAVLEFDVTLTNSALSFDYVFASEEYPEFLDNGYHNLKNDALAIFVNNQNIAWVPNTWVPGSLAPVCVFTVSPLRNNEWYHNNPLTPDEVFDVQYDGLTSTTIHPFLTATTTVQSGVPVHVKIVIADEDDSVWDSAVFIRARRTVSCADACP